MSCGTCKHWGSKYDLTDLARACQRIEQDPGNFWRTDPPPIAFLPDRDDAFAELMTRAEFGCVLHEPTEPTR